MGKLQIRESQNKTEVITTSYGRQEAKEIYASSHGSAVVAWSLDPTVTKAIVRAVNSHDDLLEACKNLLDALDKEGQVGRNSRYPKTVQHAVNAIAAATK